MELDLQIPELFYRLKETDFGRHAVIAGGYLRDQVIGIPGKDVDIFVPYVGRNAFNEVLWDNVDKLGMAITNTTKGDYPDSQFLKFDIRCDDFDIDLMGVRKNVDGFGNTLVEDFPFGNQQIYFDGKKCRTTPAFDQDVTNHYMTLYNCPSMENLPALMNKFKEVSDRYVKNLGRRLRFSTTYTLQKVTGDDWL